MKIGIGLPNPVPNILGHLLVDWAQRAEAAGFSALVTIPTPTRDQRVPILFGGTSQKTIERVVTWGAGWTAGGSQAAHAGAFADRVRSAWSEAGRSGEPRLAALTYYSLGDAAEEASRRYLLDYYRFIGDFASRIAESAHRSVSQVREAAKGFEDAGFTQSSISIRQRPHSTKLTA